MTLRGRAVADTGKPLSGRALRWYAGRRLLGTGATLSAADLPAGTIRLRLLARDAQGHRARVSERIHVGRVAPQVLEAAAAPVTRGARSATLRIAAAQPATFVFAGRRTAVGPRVRTLSLPIPAGTTDVLIVGTVRSPAAPPRWRSSSPAAERPAARHTQIGATRQIAGAP